MELETDSKRLRTWTRMIKNNIRRTWNFEQMYLLAILASIFTATKICQGSLNTNNGIRQVPAGPQSCSQTGSDPPNQGNNTPICEFIIRAVSDNFCDVPSSAVHPPDPNAGSGHNEQTSPVWIALTSGVQTVQLPVNKLHGKMLVYGVSAVPLLGSPWFTKHYAPILAAGPLSAGKLIGAASKDIFTPNLSNNNKLIQNCVNWANSAQTGGKVAIISHRPATSEAALVQVIQAGRSGMTVELVSWSASIISNSYTAIVISQEINSTMVQPLLTYVKGGGGLIILSNPWEASPDIDGHFGLHYPSNVITREAGFLFSRHRNKYLPETITPTPIQITPAFKYATFKDAFARLFKIYVNKVSDTGLNLEGAYFNLKHVFEGTPRAELLVLYNETKQLYDALPRTIITHNAPNNNLSTHLESGLFNLFCQTILIDDHINVHPAHRYFPGAAPLPVNLIEGQGSLMNSDGRSISSNTEDDFEKDSKQLGRQSPIISQDKSLGHKLVIINYFNAPAGKGRVPRSEWYSTGLWAPAGALLRITIETPGNWEKFSVIVGSHNAKAYIGGFWYRNLPLSISRPFPGAGQSATVLIKSPYGGLLYISTPKIGGSFTGGSMSLNVYGLTVRAPYYQRSKSCLEEWRRREAHHHAPWGELEGNNIILTARMDGESQMRRGLSGEAAEVLLQFWDDVLNAMADLRGVPRKRLQKERFVMDIHTKDCIHNSWNRGGYPIIIWPSHPTLDFLNYDVLLTNGSFVLFEHLGVNEVSRYMARETVFHPQIPYGYLFAIYVMNALYGVCYENIVVVDRFVLEGNEVKKLVNGYIQSNMSFAYMQKNMVTYTLVFLQLQEKYGWAPMQKVFNAFEDPVAKGHPIPLTDQDKVDLFFIIFGREVKMNLVPFVESWGLPLSNAAKTSMQDFGGATFPMETLKMQDLLTRNDRGRNTKCDGGGLGTYLITEGIRTNGNIQMPRSLSEENT